MTPVHSNATNLDDGRMSAPAAVRNAPAIVAALRPLVPDRGKVLEIASGTGEHAVALSRAFPGLDWQPTDIDPDRLTSIDAWRVSEGLTNMRVAFWLDAASAHWLVPPVDMVYLANLFHLLPDSAVQNVIRGAARVLVDGGTFFVYGPFRTGGSFRSEGDESFHERLVASDPAIGYKDLEWIEYTAAAAGLCRRAVIEMPANNLIVALRKH